MNNDELIAGTLLVASEYLRDVSQAVRRGDYTAAQELLIIANGRLIEATWCIGDRRRLLNRQFGPITR
jgi:hypothetical protein